MRRGAESILLSRALGYGAIGASLIVTAEVGVADDNGERVALLVGGGIVTAMALLYAYAVSELRRQRSSPPLVTPWMVRLGRLRSVTLMASAGVLGIFGLFLVVLGLIGLSEDRHFAFAIDAGIFLLAVAA